MSFFEAMPLDGVSPLYPSHKLLLQLSLNLKVILFPKLGFTWGSGASSQSIELNVRAILWKSKTKIAHKPNKKTKHTIMNQKNIPKDIM